MKDPRRLALSAVVFLVVLRIAIGWQLLYEGLWKIGTLETPSPWSSAGYLKNSQGPMRATFRNMAGDPDELGWLDYDTVVARWNDWADRFRSHYQLDEKQAESLRRLMDGAHSVVKDRKVYVAALDKLPSGVEKLNVSSKVIWFDGKAKRLYVDASMYLKGAERAKLESLVSGRSDNEARAFLKAVGEVFTRQKRGMGYRDRLAGALKGNADLLGNEDWQRVGKLKEYRERLTRYEDRLAKASTEFEWDHLQKTNKELQTLRGEVTSPIKAMEKELKDAADKLLTTEQRSRGAVPEPWTSLRIVNTMTIAGLTILGTLLILGLMTRFAALAAAVMLFNFYLAMPPLPGVPEMPGPEHSFIVNKNLIEVIALIGFALMPTGQWFGLDGLLSRCCSRCCGRSTSGESEASSDSNVASTSESASEDSTEQTAE
ncbi:MAG: DoxX family protein [Planctomycetota bacterium]